MRIILAIVLALSGPVASAPPDGLYVPVRFTVATTASLRGLSVVSPDVVWASGTGGTVIRTVDGGKNWSVMQVAGAEALDFRGIRAFDAQNAVIISSGPAEKGQARIFRTVDGGATWKQVYADERTGIFFDAIAFWDREHGIVLSDPVNGKFALFVTDNGGVTWEQLASATLPPALPNEGAFAASNSCLTVEGRKNVWFATGGAKVARVFRSRDRGKSWSVAETWVHPQNASSGIFSIAFFDRRHGIAVGGDYQRPDGSELPSVIRSDDGGVSWETKEPMHPPGIYLSSVVPLQGSSKKGFAAAGIKGLFTQVAGWDIVERDEWNSVALGVAGNVQSLWAVGPKGKVILYRMWLRCIECRLGLRRDTHEPAAGVLSEAEGPVTEI